jgi:hypothetical protein
MQVGFSRCQYLPCVASNAGAVRKQEPREKSHTETIFMGLLNVQKTAILLT